jgi:cephalosporin hydroxylase
VPSEAETVRAFHRLYYRERDRTWQNTFWLGARVLKCPLDLWVYQEILHRKRPDVVVECGTFSGGSALFLASMCELMGSGRVITIDNLELPGRPTHKLITYVIGSTIDPAVVAEVRQSIGGAETVMVVLDSAHVRNHVLQELRFWAPLVTEDHFLIVEDTNINGNPVEPGWGAGPREAVDAFLAESDQFVVETDCEKFFLTFSPGGYLRRRVEGSAIGNGLASRTS